MASKFFSNFPKIQYKLNDGKVIFIKDFFRKSKVEQEAVSSITQYKKYELKEGERPDTLATKLYGNADLHWVFFLVNEIENYYDWYKDSAGFEEYMTKKYPGQVALASVSTDIVSSSNKFLLGEKVTSVSSEGSIILVEPHMNRVVIEGGNFVNNETITGYISGKSFTPTSVINHRDGIAFYKKDNLRRNTEASDYTAVTHFDNELSLNEEKRFINIISPNRIAGIVRKFEEVMSA